MIAFDELYYRAPLEENGCTPNLDIPSQGVYSTFIMLINADLPMLIILVVCPLVLYRKHSRRFAIVSPSDKGSSGMLVFTMHPAGP